MRETASDDLVKTLGWSAGDQHHGHEAFENEIKRAEKSFQTGLLGDDSSARCGLVRRSGNKGIDDRQCATSWSDVLVVAAQFPAATTASTPHDTESQQAMRDLMELQARRNVLNICGTIVKASAQLLSEAASEQDDEVIYKIGSSHLMTQLLPLILAHLCPVASSDSQSAVEVLDLVQKLLKWVSTLNQKDAPTKQADALVPTDGGVGPAHYAVVESDHPYKPATVFVSKVKFTCNVRWMALEFDPRCSTTQKEDSLQLYIPSHNGLGHAISTGRGDEGDDDASTPFWPVLQRFSRMEWPAAATILPGNELVFSLETASDCAKDNKASSSYGFRCQVTGYEGVLPGSAGGLLHLEKELSYLGGMCAASLLRRDLILPTAKLHYLS
ncbi:hypothetical protein HPB51_016958 [Rhipicephalus microplus]|uniref:Uncharacterized protein n=1 Tax=Rhipicephalus microplus TaxID=6941 RepID=A0A9J6F4K9_RHIMP|nr:hypothetical protein HPB51_016958 [Rhipicephalus microplus]